MKDTTRIALDRVFNPMHLEPIHSHSDDPYPFGLMDELGKSSNETKQLFRKLFMQAKDPILPNYGVVCFRIGEGYLYGDGVQQNWDKAIYWIELGACCECNDEHVDERIVIKKLAAMFMNAENPLHSYAKEKRLISGNKPWRRDVLVMRLCKHYKNLKFTYSTAPKFD